MYTIACKFFDIFICIYPQEHVHIDTATTNKRKKIYIYIYIHTYTYIYMHTYKHDEHSRYMHTRDNFNETQSSSSFPCRYVRFCVCA